MEYLSQQLQRASELYRQAKELTLAAPALAAMLEQAEIDVCRADQISRLLALRRSLQTQLEDARRDEDSSRRAHDRAGEITSFAGLGARLIINAAITNKKWRTLARMATEKTDDKATFGTILVCVEKPGLPDGVTVISISRLARESKLEEREVLSRLQTSGLVIVGESVFSNLIGRVVDAIRVGSLSLPVAPDRLPEFMVNSKSTTDRDVE